MKDLITFNNNIYQQGGGVATGSPLVPALARMVMVQLENTIVHKLKGHLCFWKRYVEDTLTIVNLIQDGRFKKAPTPTSFFL